MMNRVIIYIHGQGGNVDEAKHYEALFESQKVIGIDYKSETPWEAAEEFSKLYDAIAKEYKSVVLIANSIGAYFAMNGFADNRIEKAIFISPIVDMEKLIMDMMGLAKQIGANLTVMKNGEHWFHTEEQMRFLDDWISKIVY